MSDHGRDTGLHESVRTGALEGCTRSTHRPRPGPPRRKTRSRLRMDVAHELKTAAKKREEELAALWGKKRSGRRTTGPC